jgi:hypothetical protein
MKSRFSMLALAAVLLLCRPSPAFAQNDLVSCPGGDAPVINIQPETEPVQYDFSRSAADLTATQTDTVSPYAPGTRTMTEGIRQDQPAVNVTVENALYEFPSVNVFCIGYQKIDVHVRLKPTIFIASEWSPGVCRDTIVGHEEKHVAVDHEVVNDFVKKLGEAIQHAVDETGVIGPINMAQEKQTEEFLNNHIQSVVESEQLPLFNEMRLEQAKVDSLQEYERVSAICNGGQ